MKERLLLPVGSWLEIRIIVIVTVAAHVAGDGSFSQFNDGILFKLDWPGRGNTPEALLKQYHDHTIPSDSSSTVVVTTGGESDQRFVCSLPQAPAKDESDTLDNYNGPSPGELLMPLYVSRSCSYRIEMYWTYELCHGRFLQQYHEEKDVIKGTNRQEYYLGQFMSDAAAQEDKAFDQLHPPRRKVDEQMLPYYPVRYLQGTVCDINNKPRTTTVMYVCLPGAKNQIYSLDEVASCDYELVLLSDRLCKHPAFAPTVNTEHAIQCFPVGATTPDQPTALTLWHKEQHWQVKQQFEDAFVSSSERLKQREQLSGVGSPSATKKQQPIDLSSTRAPLKPKPVDHQLAASFLQGDYCLYGGSGWWKHEYCHGKQVIQFHEDQKTGRIEVLLGKWNEKTHLNWIQERPHKKPLEVEGRIRQVSHYYVDGDMCDLTGRPRTVEVRLRCRETNGDSNAVSIYILEPKVCEYILGVESAMFCDILQTATDDGLLHAPPPPTCRH